jgi:hypothetical protein
MRRSWRVSSPGSPLTSPGSARVKMERDADGTTCCYGYVNFSERRDVVAAVAEFDGQLIGTGRVRLSCCLLRVFMGVVRALQEIL